MTRSVCYLDLDHTLYDTDAMIGPILVDLDDLTGSFEVVRTVLNNLNETGYSFEAHLEQLGQPSEIAAAKAREYLERLSLGDNFLYHDVADGLRALSTIADCHLLTFGFQPFQQSKFRGIPTLAGHLRDLHFVWKERSKGEVLRDHGEKDQAVFFLDDSPLHLLDAMEKAPWVRVVRMLRPGVAKPHAGDGRDWPVVGSLAEFVTMVRIAQELNHE